MEIRKMRELTEKEMLGVKKTAGYLDGECNYVMLSENVFLLLEEGVLPKGDEAVEEYVDKAINKVLRGHPDFETAVLEDNNLLAVMGNVAAFSNEAMGEEDSNKGVSKLAMGMILREELLEACKKGEIMAIVDVKKDKEDE